MGVVRSTKIALALACLLTLEGCAAIALSIAGLVGGGGLDHTLNGIVYRTYAAPVAGTRLAALQTLKHMGMTVEKIEKQDKSLTIEATATNRKIEIELEPLSDQSTRARVVVNQTDLVFIKDRSTADGILDQISVDLSRLTFKTLRFATAQMLLTELGHDPGKVDGLMGRNTRSAIIRFQRENDIRADGIVSDQLITMLRKQKAAREAAAKNAKQAKLAEQGESQTP
jgi:hypothetical protein